MSCHAVPRAFIFALSLCISLAAAADDDADGSCPADSLALAGNCHSHFELQTGFFDGSWLENGTKIDRISDVLQSGRAIIIKNAVINSVAAEMREELRKVSKKSFQLKESHDHSKITMPERDLWKGNNVGVCGNVTNYFLQFTTESASKVCFHQHHAKELNEEQSPRLTAFVKFMKSEPVQRLLATLTGACDPQDDCDLKQLPNVPNSKVGDVSHDVFWQQKGDYVGTTRDARPGQLFSATLYLSDDEFHGPKHGGNLIWCTPFQRISPDFNTLVLYRVSQQSWHVVQPVVNKSPVNRGVSFWYKMAGGEKAAETEKFARDWASRDFKDTMSPVERGAEIRKKA